MDGFNACPPSQTVKPDQIFAGIRIFVQASGIGTDRPKFIRTLKERGAATCSILNDSQIILINSESEEGQALIPPWSNLPEPKLLTLDWVQKCIKAGRALLAEDNWGGSLVKYDRASHQEEDDDDWEEDEAEIQSKSPLPTPRQTPSEPSGTQSWLSDSSARGSASQPTQAARQGGEMAASALPITPLDPSMVVPTDSLQSAQPFSSPFSVVNGVAALSPQFALQMAAMFNPLATAMDPRVNPQTAPMDPRAMAMLQAMQDIMTRANTGSPMQPPVYTSGQQSPVQEQVLPFPDVPSSTSEKHSSRNVVSDSPSIIARRSFDELSDGHSASNKKGKGRTSSPIAKRRKTSSSSHQIMASGRRITTAGGPSSQTTVFVEFGRPLSFFVQIDLHNRGAVVDAIKRNGGRIEKDPENADYVVLYSGHRHQKTFNDLLLSAHTAGKPAVRSTFVYDCAAEGNLLDHSEYEFESTAKRKRKSTAVKNEALSLGDEKEHLYKNASQADRKKLQQTEKGRAPTAPNNASLTTKVKIEKINTPQTKNTLNVALYASGRSSPIPPSEHTRQPWAAGYKFTVEEDQFLCDYAQILVERDHTISLSAIADRIHAKMPHHSLNSWKTRIGRVIQSKLDDWRKRSAIAYRKALKTVHPLSSKSTVFDIDADDSNINELTSDPSSIVPQDEPAFSNTNAVLPNDPESVLKHEKKAYVEQDIEVVSRYFATLDDDGQEPEEAVWARLSKQSPCRAWNDWAAFYEAHYDQVQKRYAELASIAQVQR